MVGLVGGRLGVEAVERHGRLDEDAADRRRRRRHAVLDADAARPVEAAGRQQRRRLRQGHRAQDH